MGAQHRPRRTRGKETPRAAFLIPGDYAVFHIYVIFWVDQNLCSGFSVTSDGKTQAKFLATSVIPKVFRNWVKEYYQEASIK